MMPTRQQTLVAVLLLAAWMGPLAAAQAGVVATIAGRRGGAIGLQPGAVRVGSDAVPWSDVMFIVNDPAPGTTPATSALRFKNGEVWVGKIIRMSRMSVTFESTIAGEREVQTTELSAIDFAAGAGAVEGEKRGSLYRETGKPVVGKILWLKGDRLAIDTSIGAVELKAAGLRRYVFETEPAAAMPLAGDEVRLTDGSILRGTVAPAQDLLIVEHAVLGKHSLGPQRWASIRRYSGPAVYLTDLLPVSVETFPLIRRPADQPRIEFNPSGEAGPVNRLLVSPKSRLEYKVPGRPGEKYLLTAAVQLSEGTRGSARFEIHIDGKALLDKVLSPSGEKQVAVSFEVPVGSNLEIKVDFDDRVRFPCGVSIDNALLVKK